MRTCPQCGFVDPAFAEYDRRREKKRPKRDRAEYSRKRRAKIKAQREKP